MKVHRDPTCQKNNDTPGDCIGDSRICLLGWWFHQSKIPPEIWGLNIFEPSLITMTWWGKSGKDTSISLLSVSICYISHPWKDLANRDGPYWIQYGTGTSVPFFRGQNVQNGDKARLGPPGGLWGLQHVTEDWKTTICVLRNSSVFSSLFLCAQKHCLYLGEVLHK